MERVYLSRKLRDLVAERANHACEYCKINEQDTALSCAIDHIISLKHGGSNEADNLAYACVFCNRYKGSDIGSIIWETKDFVRFYHPRWDVWEEHFQFQQTQIKPLTPIGNVTAKILCFNEPNRILERQYLLGE
ncbi:HNH endonuclease [[Limnothrix rosea] IAM M-220]|uniref:HNH endonuclease n=1 Tax=[Limnothrix rosea] IAM M-220 TaxID=454133 RepID=UPI00095BDEDB|nr:HNH endonuclease [[Limnothrix rosea] IAM M-220]OKH15181.1 HNH endonuclease [[Limnothrix rosea] IAM M-220]